MFRWGFIACAATAVAGCAQLAGIDSTSKAPDGGDNIARLTLEHASIGRLVVRAPQDVTGLSASFLIPDAAAPGGLRTVPATSVVDTFQGDVGGMPAMVQYESPELPATTIRILDLPSRTLKTFVPVLEHPNPSAPTANAMLNINVGLNPAQNVETYQLFTVGAWINIGLPAPGAGAGALAPGPITPNANNTPGRRLDKLTVDDLVLLLRYSGNQLVGHLSAPPFDQMTADAIGGTIAPTPLNQMLDIRVNQMAAAARVSTVRPAVGAAAYVWRLNASPGLDLNVQNGPQLHAAGLTAPAAADPQTVTATYGNPFSTNLRTLLTWDVRGSRTYTGGNMNTATLVAGLFERQEPSAQLMLSLPAGLPDRITANGTVLNVDNVMLNAPMDAPVTVTFATDNMTNTLYNLELFELVPGMAGTAFTVNKVVTVTSTMPNMKVPREHFKPSTLYFLRAVTFQGCYTAVAEGDLTKMALPCAQGFADSGVFQVMP